MPSSLQQKYDDLQFAHGQRGAVATGDALTIQLGELLLSHGVEIRASDIHIEPTASGARIRYRIDGLLYELLTLSAEVRDPLTRSIKLKANMAIEAVGRSKPQDGRIDYLASGRPLDLRLSSFPTIFGDVLAIRILDRSTPLLPLEGLGFPDSTFKPFWQIIQRPSGLFLVTGPANSGKTTTLYGVLGKLHSPRIKIVTLEDPVEYQLEGIDQAQINSAVGVTFASGLRAILRQDANVILVGEIRDAETAEIAIRASLTGHRVFSTLHTRHACGAVVRLMDMGIEPHLIVASASGVLAQRLIRTLCPSCKSVEPAVVGTVSRLWAQENSVIQPPEPSTIQGYRSVGCAACSGTGYRGRTGIFELLILHDELKRLIIERDPAQLYKTALTAGMRTMLLDGLDKVARGVTTVEEVLRVTGETGNV